jgi:hypothetical protein
VSQRTGIIESQSEVIDFMRRGYRLHCINRRNRLGYRLLGRAGVFHVHGRVVDALLKRDAITPMDADARYHLCANAISTEAHR